jgi:hypothetical protein
VKDQKQLFNLIIKRLEQFDYPLLWTLAVTTLPLDLITQDLLPPIDSRLLIRFIALSFIGAMLGIYRKQIIWLAARLQKLQGRLVTHKLSWIGPAILIALFGVDLATRLKSAHFIILFAWLGMLVAFSWKIYGFFLKATKEAVQQAHRNIIPINTLALLLSSLIAARLFSFCLQLYLKTEHASALEHYFALLVGFVLLVAFIPPALPGGDPCGQCLSKISRLRHRSVFCRGCRRFLEPDVSDW